MEHIQNLINEVENFIHDLDTANIIITDKGNDVKVFVTYKGKMGFETKKRNRAH